jgi:hypothetical protein
MMGQDDHIMINFKKPTCYSGAFAENAAFVSTNRQDVTCPSSCDLCGWTISLLFAETVFVNF